MGDEEYLSPVSALFADLLRYFGLLGDGNRGAALLGDALAVLLGSPDRHLGAVLLGHPLAALLGHLLALLLPIAAISRARGLSALLLVAGGALLLVGGGALLLVAGLVGGGALLLVAGAALLLVLSPPHSLIHSLASWSWPSASRGGDTRHPHHS